MRAIVWTKYGPPDGLQLAELAKPAPGDREVLVKVHATTASAADTEMRRLALPLPFALPLRLYLGLRRPSRITVLGTEFAGEVVAAGKGVTRYEPGDQVFGYTGLGMGAYAEYICLGETPTAMGSVMAHKPAGVSYEEAAAVVFGGLEALHALRKADLQPGQRVLVVGAGGSIGTCAVQLAKHYGAEVTGVDRASKHQMLRSIGADHVIDHAQEDYTRSGQTYDVILDTAGKVPFSGGLRLLKENGIFLNPDPGPLGALHLRWASSGGRRILPWTAGYSAKNLLELKALMEARTLKAVIDRRYPLEQAAEAHRYVETGQKQGNVVISVAG